MGSLRGLHWLTLDDLWSVNHNDVVAASKLLWLESWYIERKIGTPYESLLRRPEDLVSEGG